MLSSIKANASVRDHNSISSQHAGSWLRAVCNTKLGLAMNKKEFVISLCMWLGIAIFPSPSGAL